MPMEVQVLPRRPILSMSTTLESVNKDTGTLDANAVVRGEITSIIAQLYAVKITSKEAATAQLIEEARQDLVRLRSYLDKHFQYKPADKSKEGGMANVNKA